MKRCVSLLALLALGACKDKGKSSDPPTGEAPTAAKQAPNGNETEAPKPAGAGPMKIEALGLTADVPAGTKIKEMAGSQMLQGPGFVVSVKEAGSSAAESIEAEVAEAKDMYSGTNITQEEVEGGWHVTFENTGSMGTNYMVRSHLTIDGKSYVCSTTSSSKAQMDAALDVCKSLKK